MNRWIDHLYTSRRVLVGLCLGALLLAWRAPTRVVAQDATPPRGALLLSNDKTYSVRWELTPAEFDIHELFELHFSVERVDGAAAELSYSVDARMPEHGHGMNREPVLKRADDGGVLVQNLLFHMPGYWEVYFDITEGAVCERAQISLELE